MVGMTTIRSAVVILDEVPYSVLRLIKAFAAWVSDVIGLVSAI